MIRQALSITGSLIEGIKGDCTRVLGRSTRYTLGTCSHREQTINNFCDQMWFNPNSDSWVSSILSH